MAVTIPYVQKIDFEFRLPDGTKGRMSALADVELSTVDYETETEDTAFGPKIKTITLDAHIVSDSLRMHIIETDEDV